MSAPTVRRACCPTCGRRLDVAPRPGHSDSVDLFPVHPPTGKRRCAQSRQAVPATAYLDAGGPQ